MHLKRFMSLIITLLLLMTSIIPVGATFAQPTVSDSPRRELSDVGSHWANEYINSLYSNYIVNGYPDGSFKPDNSITRAEMAVILVNGLGLTPDENPQLGFTDSSDIESWAAGYISKLAELKIVNGYPDGSFMPNNEITRSEIAVMIIRSQNISVTADVQTSFADNSSIPDWAIGYIAKAAELKIIIGSLVDDKYYFNPSDNATRAEVCVMIDKMMKLPTPEPTLPPTQELTASPTIEPTQTPTPSPTLPPTPTPAPGPGVNLIPYDKNTTINAIQSPWKLVGPGGGGAMFVPTVSITDPDTAMVVSDMTGTFITHDGGKQWKEINLRTRVDAIAFDPIDPNTIYAASTGLFKSVDKGESWKLIYPNPDLGISESMIGDHADHSFNAKDNWPGGMVQFIYIDPQQPNNIYLGIQSSTLVIYYSKDTGKTWVRGPQFGSGNFLKMYIDPTSPADNRNMYVFTDAGFYRLNSAALTPVKVSLPARITAIKSVACGINPTTNNSIFYINTTGIWSNGVYMSGIMKSSDYGDTWTEMATGLNKDLPATGSGEARQYNGIVTSEKDARTVYVAVERCYGLPTETYLGMFKSEDEGITWDWALRIGSQQNPSNFIYGWLERDYNSDWSGPPKCLAVCPNNPDVLYYTGIGMAFKTADGGKTFEQVYSKDNPDGTSSSNGLEVTTTYDVKFDPFDKNHMVVMYTDIGLFQSFDGGASMKHAINGIPVEWSNTCYSMVFDPAVQGRAWSVWSSCHDLPREKMFRSGNLAAYGGGVAKTNDGLTTWIKSNKGIAENRVMTQIILDPTSAVGSRTLYSVSCGWGIYKSVDDGVTWKPKSKGINGTLGNIYSWRMALTSDGTLYLIVVHGNAKGVETPGAIYKSTDGAENWVQINLPQEVTSPNDIVADPTNPNRLYLACWPKKVSGLNRAGGLYVTEDGGNTWELIYDQTSHVYSVAIDPNDSSILYIVTFDGAAYRSEDRGKSWSLIKGYDFKWGHRPIPDPYNKDMLYITTFGSSVWYGPAKQADPQP